MKKILKFIVLCQLLLMSSCNDSSNLSEKNNTNSAQEQMLKLKLDILKYDQAVFSPEADSLVQSWSAYKDFKNEVSRFENYTLQDVISNIPTIEKAIDSLQKNIPKIIDTFPVTSRLNVLHTKTKHLFLLSNKQRPKLKSIKKIAEGYPFDFNALNIQINEVFIEMPKFE